MFADIAEHANQLSKGDIRPHVRMLAEERVRPTELPGDTLVPPAEKPRIFA